MKIKPITILISILSSILYTLSFNVSACTQPYKINLEQILVTSIEGPSGEILGGTSLTPGYITQASVGDRCVVGVELSPNLRISRIELVDENNNVILGNFKIDRVVARSLGRGYTGFVALAAADIPTTNVSLRIEAMLLRPSIQLPEIVDLLSRARVVTATLNSKGNIGNHFATTAALKNSTLCLDVNANGRPLCPPKIVEPEVVFPPSITLIPIVRTMAQQFIDGTCPDPFTPCNCTLNGFQTPCDFVSWCLDIGACEVNPASF